jgi:hypothetical protein
MSETNSICQTKISTFFVFDSPTVQTAANSVYVNASTFNVANAANGRKYQFKTDFERMQYILGLYGRDSEGRR